MKIAVLIKQTPQVASITVSDKATWPDSDMIINPFDEYALEEALRLKEKLNCKTAALSFGKAAAETALRDALALGIDEAYLIADDNLDYLNPQKAAATLAKAIAKIGDVTIVLTGKQATDDDSSLVGPAVAAYLGWPQVGFIRKFELVELDKLICQRTTDEGYDRVEVHLPGVFSVVKEINEPRLPSLRGKMQAKKATITKWSLQEIGGDSPGHLGLRSISAPPRRIGGEILSGDVDESVEKLVAKLKENQLL